MTVVAISLGSNQGDSRSLLRSAVANLRVAVTDSRIASLYRSTPVSAISQPDFLNTALVGKSGLDAEDLLALLKECEHLAGRRLAARWGPRPLDLDLLTYGNVTIDRPELTLPHPRLRERRFYLEPVAEIAPDLEVPPDGATVASLLAALPDEAALEKVEGPGTWAKKS